MKHTTQLTHAPLKGVKPRNRVNPITNEDELQEAHKRLNQIIEAIEGTAEYEELIELSDMIEAYEKMHYPINRATPEAIAKLLRESNEN